MILEPLIGDVPLVGAITMFFIRRPVSVAPQVNRVIVFQFCTALLYVYRSIHMSLLLSVIETGHQLDWADQPVRYPWAEVSYMEIYFRVWLH